MTPEQREYARRWRDENREQRNAYNREYYANNRKRVDAVNRRWAENHPEQVRAYSRQSYARHREERLKILKHRRATDPDFRESLRQIVYASFDKNRQRRYEKTAERMANDSEFAERNKTRWKTFRERVQAGYKPAPDPIYRTVAGNSVRLYRCSETARKIGCAQGTVMRWHSHGWIPEPLYEKRRLYTADQIELMKLFFLMPKHNHDKRSAMSKFIIDNWEK